MTERRLTRGAADSVTAAKSINELNSDLSKQAVDARFQSPVEARKKAMDYLARREYGRHELEKKLVKAGFDPDVSIAAVLQLTQDNLQDDRRFTECFVQSRINQGKGPVRIHVDLDQRDVVRSLVETVLDDMDVDWFELVRAVRRKKFGLSRPVDFKEKARQMRFLQYRGFEQDHLQAAFVDTGNEGGT